MAKYGCDRTAEKGVGPIRGTGVIDGRNLTGTEDEVLRR